MSNPFDDGDVAVASTRSKPAPYRPITRKAKETDEWAAYEKSIEASMQSTLDSTQRSRMMLEESEQAGIKTAEELVRQGETLHKVDTELDNINASTHQTQRNLNNIKSVFGGFKNYFSKKAPEAGSSAATGVSDKQRRREADGMQRLPDAIDANRDAQHRPAVAHGSIAEGRTLNPDSRAAIKGTRWEKMDEEVDENLDLMAANLRRLQGLGTELGNEVDRQNDVLERISRKTDKTDSTIRDQDKQMKKLLGSDGKKATTIKNSASVTEEDGGGGGISSGLADMTRSTSVGGWKFTAANTARKWFS